MIVYCYKQSENFLFQLLLIVSLCFSNNALLSKTGSEKNEAILSYGQERAVPASGVSWGASPNKKVIII